MPENLFIIHFKRGRYRSFPLEHGRFRHSFSLKPFSTFQSLITDKEQGKSFHTFLFSTASVPDRSKVCLYFPFPFTDLVVPEDIGFVVLSVDTEAQKEFVIG